MDHAARDAFLLTLSEGSQGAAYFDPEAGEVVIDGHFDPAVLDEALGSYMVEVESPSRA